MQKTSIIMAVFPDHFEYMKASIESIRRFTKKGSYELIILESGGSLETRAWLAEETEIRSLFFDQNITISQALNEGAQASKYDSILFMHEDTLVTENWLELLLEELYKNNNIGAVGPITNYADGGQAETTQFSSMEEMLLFAKSIEKTKFVEERLTLSAFCLLLKRSVLEIVGTFDEQLNGDNAVTDICLRIKETGFSLALCRNVYLHHYGSNEICTDKVQRRRFKNKWGFNVEDTKVESNALKMLNIPFEVFSRILVVGLVKGEDATSLKIKQMYPNADVHYYHQDEISSSLNDGKFDYIILATKINLDDTLSVVKDMLSEQGQLIVELSNIHYLRVVQRLLLGEGLEYERNYYKLMDIASLFEDAGFQELDFEYIFNDNLHAQDNSFMERLGELVEELPQEFGISSFLVSARLVPKNELLHKSFDKLLQMPSDDVLSDIHRFSTTQIISSIDSYDGFVVPLLNYLGVSNFERKKLDDVLPYLIKAFKLETRNSFTLINLATVMHSIGNDEQALSLLERVEDKNENVNNWISELERNIYINKLADTKVKFLLRRIENDVEREASSMELIALLQQNGVSANQVIDSVMVDIVDKIGTLNRVAINCFNSGLYEVVIPLLEKSYTVDPENEDTLFNLGYILFKFGAFNEALDFVKKIREPDDDVMRLQQDIERGMNHGYK